MIDNKAQRIYDEIAAICDRRNICLQDGKIDCKSIYEAIRVMLNEPYKIVDDHSYLDNISDHDFFRVFIFLDNCK